MSFDSKGFVPSGLNTLNSISTGIKNKCEQDNGYTWDDCSFPFLRRFVKLRFRVYPNNVRRRRHDGIYFLYFFIYFFKNIIIKRSRHTFQQEIFNSENFNDFFFCSFNELCLPGLYFISPNVGCLVYILVRDITNLTKSLLI